jgi:hypothetical protein
MHELLATFRSVKVYTKPADIDGCLDERLASAGPNKAFAATRFLSRGDRTMVCARSPFSVSSSDNEDMSPDTIKSLAEKAGLKWNAAYAERAWPVWSSDQSVNRYGDIDLQNWKLDNYNQNPLVLLGHQWDALPIGASISHSVKNRVYQGYNGPGLRQIMLFADPQTSAVAEGVNRLWGAGFLRTVSVGFFPGKIIDVTDEAERAQLGLGKWGMIFDDNELVEVSPVSVPALPTAHNSASRSFQPGDIELVREFVRREIQGTEEARRWKEIDKNIRSTWKILHPDAAVREHEDVDSPVNFEVTTPSASENSKIEALYEEIKALKARISNVEQTTQRVAMSGVTKALADIDSAVKAVTEINKA